MFFDQFAQAAEGASCYLATPAFATVLVSFEEHKKLPGRLPPGSGRPVSACKNWARRGLETQPKLANNFLFGRLPRWLSRAGPNRGGIAQLDSFASLFQFYYEPTTNTKPSGEPSLRSERAFYCLHEAAAIVAVADINQAKRSRALSCPLQLS